jgi:hypothetical protein
MMMIESCIQRDTGTQNIGIVDVQYFGYLDYTRHDKAAHVRDLHDRRICIGLELLCYVTNVCSPHAHNFFYTDIRKQGFYSSPPGPPPACLAALALQMSSTLRSKQADCVIS